MDKLDYIGKVVNNEDPTFSGRCQIRVFGEFGTADDISDEMLPWFTPINSGVFSGSGSGSIDVPKVGSVVRVKFNGGDVYNGEYYALQYVDPDLIEEIKDEYKDTHVLLFDSQKDLAVIYQPLSGIKMWLNGSCVQIFPDGRIKIAHENNANVIEVNESDINITTANPKVVNGKTTESVTGTNNIPGGNNVNITGGSVNVISQDVKLGANASSPAVVGTELQAVLKAFAIALDMKMPPGDPMAGMSFSNILSNSVKIAK